VGIIVTFMRWPSRKAIVHESILHSCIWWPSWKLMVHECHCVGIQWESCRAINIDAHTQWASQKAMLCMSKMKILHVSQLDVWWLDTPTSYVTWHLNMALMDNGHPGRPACQGHLRPTHSGLLGRPPYIRVQYRLMDHGCPGRLACQGHLRPTHSGLPGRPPYTRVQYRLMHNGLPGGPPYKSHNEAHTQWPSWKATITVEGHHICVKVGKSSAKKSILANTRGVHK
jgi:hypothetical protein